jgi:hypothetical protein
MFDPDIILKEALYDIDMRELKEAVIKLESLLKCTDCGGKSSALLNGLPYCSSCFYEHTGGR